MPLQIVRNDITLMSADAIVNTANPKPVVGTGVDTAIHEKAGCRLLKARKKIGDIPVGQAAITPAFDLKARYVIHAVGPIWIDGTRGETELLKQCYENALALALENQCHSVAFPLISSGNDGFPNDIALQVAMEVFSRFLMNHEMAITLAVFNRDAFTLSGTLFNAVSDYIDENYVREKTLKEYGARGVFKREPNFDTQLLDEASLPTIVPGFLASSKTSADDDVDEESFQKDLCLADEYTVGSLPDFDQSLEDLLAETDAGFSETLLKLIDRSGKTDAEIYRKANVSRQHFSKIRNNKDYKPTLNTAVAFAIALELDWEQTADFLSRAGYVLTHSRKFDIIVEYFIRHGQYNIFEINEVLFAFDQPLIGV